MSDILDQIVANKKKEIAVQKLIIPTEELKRYKFHSGATHYSLSENVKDRKKTGVIAEYKRKSPSKGIINSKFKPAEIAQAYERGGASGVSVLTDKVYFDGNIDYLYEAKNAVNIPVLRKEFIVDPYQIIEASLIGADAILLICECLTKEQVSDFTSVAHDLGLEVLLELHSEDQLNKVDERVDLIGVNNRDLKSFKVDFDRSIKLLSKLPHKPTKIAESGLKSIDDMINLYDAGFDGFLIGETFMKQDDPIGFSETFLKEFKKRRDTILA